MLNCLSSQSLKTYQKAVRTQKQKAGFTVTYDNVELEAMRVSINNGSFYLAYVETSDKYVFIGYHLNNNDIDEDGNFIYNLGISQKDIARIHTLVNNNIRL